ncbi:phosphatase 2C-domain-containing protein [Mycena sanguinolenta]|nr:phosphatase 2C-domain-containing protein [Mycena sanguinolenta]
MVLRSAYYYAARFRPKRLLPSPALTIPRPLAATGVALGLSASIYLAALNTVHGDTEEDDPEPVPSSENAAEQSPPPLNAGFTADITQWPLSIRYLGDHPPDGIVRMYWFTHYDTRLRIMSRGHRALISLLEGDFVNHANIADVIQENLWFNVENLFRWYQTDHTNPQPVEFMQEIHPPPNSIVQTIKTSISLSDEYVLNHLVGRVFSTLSKRNAPEAIKATSSSCLISALYEGDVGLLHVASLGNMRALLGRPRTADDGTVTYGVHVLSFDHSPDNPAEKSRIEGLHAGENVFEDGTLFGRPYTRALGDGKVKWSTDVQTRLHRDYIGAAPDPRVKTPPYISAEPDVSTIKIMPGDFLVLSSRWLAECLTDEEVVGLVGVWLNKNQDTHLHQALDPVNPSDPPPGVIITPDDLPVELKEDKTVMYRKWNVPKQFVNLDHNPSTHLAHNAMGGADLDLRKALLELAPSDSEGNTKALGIAVVIFK